MKNILVYISIAGQSAIISVLNKNQRVCEYLPSQKCVNTIASKRETSINK